MARCQVCRTEYKKWRLTQKVCGSVVCAQAYAERVREKQERRELRARKEKLKTRSDYMKEAQVAFNAYIRERDKDKPCICCGAPLNAGAVGGGFDAGHYRSVGSAPHLRFVEANCHGQTKQCNRYGSGRAVDYRLGLIQRIGLAAVESLESDQAPKRYTIDDLKAIRAEYKQKLKALKTQPERKVA